MSAALGSIRLARRSSVTEQEVVRGILNAKDREDHTLAFFRHIENINISLLRHSMKFIDIVAKQVDFEAQRMLSDLRDVRVKTFRFESKRKTRLVSVGRRLSA